eukprot:scaffold87999_cov14-Tisochrysis_lutea.AAC.1
MLPRKQWPISVLRKVGCALSPFALFCSVLPDDASRQGHATFLVGALGAALWHHRACNIVSQQPAAGSAAGSNFGEVLFACGRGKY